MPLDYIKAKLPLSFHLSSLHDQTLIKAFSSLLSHPQPKAKLSSKSLLPNLSNQNIQNRKQSPMEKNSTSSLSSSELITILILQSIISFFTKLLKLSKRFLSLLYHSRIHIEQAEPKSHLTGAVRAEQDIFISKEDAELVMKKMGLIREDASLEKFVVSEEVASMFEDREPSLQEVKEAFAVFDENGDGFVEAGELQRVLCNLGFVREVGLDLCEEMIVLHDKDGDGRIDFADFVKLMESSFG